MPLRSLTDVSTFLNIPYITLTDWIKNGDFVPPAKVGGTYVFTDDDMDRLRKFLADRQYVPGGKNQGRPPKTMAKVSE